MNYGKWPFQVAMIAAVASAAGCAGPGPALFPPGPTFERFLDPGRIERGYDLNGDGRIEYSQILSPGGPITILRFHPDGNGLGTEEVSRLGLMVRDALSASDIAGGAAACEVPHLLLLLDSVPYSMVRDLYDHGRLRLFYRPSRVIPPFPVMTDLCYGEFFGVSPSPGVEAQFYDGRRMNNGFDSYIAGDNAPWYRCIDYHIKPWQHGPTYLWPNGWFRHELRDIQRLRKESSANLFIGYCVGTSAFGSGRGRNGHQVGLILVDRLAEELTYHYRGRIHITVMSDHGHNLLRSERIPLRKYIERCGYRVTDKLERDFDVVIPEFGPVSVSHLYTRQPAPLARDAVGMEGVELAFHRAPADQIAVRSRDGQARIAARDGRYRYEVDFGDPLQLRPIWDELARRGAVDADGFAGDRELFEATRDHVYPDPLARVWRAFHGLTSSTPDVILSLHEGYHVGSEMLSNAIVMRAVHGNLRGLSSETFVMSTAGELPPVLRTDQVRAELIRIGVPFADHRPLLAER